MLCLEGLELTEERVVLGIRDLDPSLVVVELVVPEDLRTKPVETLLGLLVCALAVTRVGRRLHWALPVAAVHGHGRRRAAPIPRPRRRPAPSKSRPWDPVISGVPPRFSCCRRRSMEESVPHRGGRVHAGARDHGEEDDAPPRTAPPAGGPPAPSTDATTLTPLMTLTTLTTLTNSTARTRPLPATRAAPARPSRPSPGQISHAWETIGITSGGG